MQRTKISVGYTHTHNLGNYSNARPSILIEATLDDGDNAAAVTAQLHAEAVAYVHEAIDQALEADNQRAYFSDAPRYAVLATARTTVGTWRNEQTHQPPENLVAVVPAALVRALKPVDAKTFWRTRADGLRELHALRVASTYVADHPGTRTIACLDGDLTRLPLWATEIIPEPPAPADAAPEPLFGEDYPDEDESDA